MACGPGTGMPPSSVRPPFKPTRRSWSRYPTISPNCSATVKHFMLNSSPTDFSRRAQPMQQHFNEKNRDLIVNINGRLVHRDQAGVSPFDSAVQGGDAVWEGLRLYNGRIFKLHEHLDRLERSARALSIVDLPTHEKIIEELKRTLAANKMRGGVHIRLTLTRGVKITSGMDPRLNQSGATLIVLAEHKAPVYSKDGLKLITASIRR